MSEFLGTTTYASGETRYFTDSAVFLKELREELPGCSISGFQCNTVYTDEITLKAADDMIYNLQDEPNPHDADHYRDHAKCCMTDEEKSSALNSALYEKLFAEQSDYRNWLLKQPSEEILKHTYEYTVREDILIALEEHDLEDEQVEALLHFPGSLQNVFYEFEKRETDHMNIVWDSLEAEANMQAERLAEERQMLWEVPVYPHSVLYAGEAGELEVYRTSHRANIACRDAIEVAIQKNYHDNRLDSKEAVKEVVKCFGMERPLYVLASTVREKEWDGRISPEQKAWAKTMPVVADIDQWNQNRNRDFVVDQVNTGLTDLFLRQLRYEQHSQSITESRERTPKESRQSVRSLLQKAPIEQDEKKVPQKKHKESER